MIMSRDRYEGKDNVHEIRVRADARRVSGAASGELISAMHLR